MDTKIFTLAEFADAIEKDGLPQAREYFFVDSDGSEYNTSYTPGSPIVAACAVGMACINLGVKVQPLRSALHFETMDYSERHLAGKVETWNDQGLNFAQIAKRIRETYGAFLDTKFTVEAEEYETVG